MKVLLVEDTKTITSLIQIYLMGWGLEFILAVDGLEGFRLAQEARPALIISDVGMPKMDGFELCAAVRSDRDLFNTPFVLLTGLKDETSRQKGRLVGATAFLTKPITPEDLREQVRTLLKLEVRG